MGNPLSRFHNLTVTLQRGNGVFVRDADTGNRVEGFTSEILRLTGKEIKNKDTSQAGVPPSSIYFDCYLLAPKLLPTYIDPGERYKAVLIDSLTKNEIEGEFVVELTAQSRVKQVSKILGNQLQGWFVTV